MLFLAGCVLWGLGFTGALWFYFEGEKEKAWAFNLGRRRASARPVFSKRDRPGLMMELADFLDLVALGMSGGLTMENSWRLGVAHASAGRLRNELRWVQDALFLGRPREEAFQELDRRLGQHDLHLFFALLIQSMRAGSRLQNLFHNQAEALRRARLMQMERRAQTAPLRLLLPLFLFIFPTIFLILFGPVLIRVSQGGVFF